jgi:hypothetical protein
MITVKPSANKSRRGTARNPACARRSANIPNPQNEVPPLRHPIRFLTYQGIRTASTT